MANAVVHWEIAGHHIAALQDFYAKAFGWSIHEGGTGYFMVDPTDGGLGGGLMQATERMTPYVTIYVQVDDLEAALETITGLGGEPLVSPTRIDETMSFAMFRDPEGNIVGLLRAAAPLTE